MSNLCTVYNQYKDLVEFYNQNPPRSELQAKFEDLLIVLAEDFDVPTDIPIHVMFRYNQLNGTLWPSTPKLCVSLNTPIPVEFFKNIPSEFLPVFFTTLIMGIHKMHLAVLNSKDWSKFCNKYGFLIYELSPRT